MSRTYRCEKTVPTGLTVRDGHIWIAYDRDNKEYYRGDSWHTQFGFRRHWNIFGVSNQDEIASIELIWRELPCIRRFAPSWTKKPGGFKPYGYDVDKVLLRRMGRRKAKQAIARGDYSYAMWD